MSSLETVIVLCDAGLLFFLVGCDLFLCVCKVLLNFKFTYIYATEGIWFDVYSV